jgi:hypothetical protein
MKTLEFLIPLLLASSTACTTVDTIDSGDAGLHLPALQSYTLYVSTDVDTDGHSALSEAVHQWTEYTDVQITLLPGTLGCIDPGCFEIKQVSLDQFNAVLSAFSTSGDSHYIGYTVPWYVFISTSITTYDELQDTVIHELGHMLGLEHPCAAPCGTYAVMNPDYLSGADRVVCADVSQYYSIRPTVDAGDVPVTCTDEAGPADESPDGGPAGD